MKEEVTNFKDDIFYDFYKNVGNIDCEMIKLVTDNKLNLNGTLNQDNISIKDLWLYIYYLRQNNLDKDELNNLSIGGNASSTLFAELVLNKSENGIKQSLIKFINDLNVKDLDIPVLNNLYNSVLERIQLDVQGVVDKEEDKEEKEKKPLKLCASFGEENEINITTCT